MLGIGRGVEFVVEAGDTAAVFRRCVPFASDVARIAGALCALASLPSAGSREPPERGAHAPLDLLLFGNDTKAPAKRRPIAGVAVGGARCKEGG